MPTFQLAFVDYASLLIYFVSVVGIGFALKRYTRSSRLFPVGGSILACVAGVAFLSATRARISSKSLAVSMSNELTSCRAST